MPFLAFFYCAGFTSAGVGRVDVNVARFIIPHIRWLVCSLLKT